MIVKIINFIYYYYCRNRQSQFHWILIKLDYTTDGNFVCETHLKEKSSRRWNNKLPEITIVSRDNVDRSSALPLQIVSILKHREARQSVRNLRIDPRRYRERAINVPAAVEREVPNNSHFMLSRFRYVAVSFPPRHSVYVIPVATIASLSLLRVSWLQSGLPFALIVTYPAVRQLLQASSSPPPPPPLFFLPTRKLLWMSSFLLIIPSKLVFHQVFYTCYYEDNIKISRF